jgi:release factor glutamine methyltransferase
MPYTPAEDSYLTLEALEELSSGDLCVDVGTGSCMLAEALLGKCRQVVALDVDLEACRSCPREVDVVCGDAAEALRRCDVLVSNLPYLPPEEPLDIAIHDLGIVPKLLRWVAAHRPRVVVFTFSSLGRMEHLMDALRAMCRVTRISKLHMFFEDIITVVATCPQADAQNENGAGPTSSPP